MELHVTCEANPVVGLTALLDVSWDLMPRESREQFAQRRRDGGT